MTPLLLVSLFFFTQIDLDASPALHAPLFAPPAQVESIELGGGRARVIVGPGFFARSASEEIAEQDRVDAVLGLLEQQGGFARVDFLVEEGGRLSPPPRRQWPVLRQPSRPPLWRVDPPAGRYPLGAPLLGTTVALSAGHGWINDTGSWRTQRGRVFFDGCGGCRGVVEDFSNADLVDRWLIPMLEGAGARVVVVRERSMASLRALVDDGDGDYQETGAWRAGASAGGWQDDYRVLAPGESGEARYSLRVNSDGPLLITLRYREGGNRSDAVQLDVIDAAGTIRYGLNQQAFGERWLPLGVHSFVAGQAVEVVLSPGAGDGYLIADAVKAGGGTHSAGYPWWQMSAKVYVPNSGASSAVTGRGDVTIRPSYAEYVGADVYLAIHSNATGGAGTASGSTSYRFNCLSYADHSSDPPAADCDDPAGSDRLQELVHDHLIARLRQSWDPGWCDRGTRVANFGELRELVDMPGTLVEIAFHDNVGAPGCSTGSTPRQGDNRSLHDPGFRRLVGRGLYEGVLDYLSPGAPAILDPPTGLRLIAHDDRALEIAWEAVPGAAAYRVYLARDGRAFDQGHDSPSASLRLSDLDPLSPVCARIASINAGGVGLAGDTLCARPRMARTNAAPADLLLVDAFDREDPWVQAIDNQHNATQKAALALTAITDFDLAADASSDEALVSGAVSLVSYRAVIFAFGLESTVNRTFTAELQNLVDAYRVSGGVVIASGAEIGWDLSRTGDAADHDWLKQTFAAAYASDDANTYELSAEANGPLAGLGPLSFCCATGDGGESYDVRYADTWSVEAGGTVSLSYAGGEVAAVAQAGVAPTLLLGFPFETVLGADARRALMQAMLSWALRDLSSGDLDRDGMPDEWERQHGFDPSDASDASGDADGDRVSNLQEYLDGTDPGRGDSIADAGIGNDAATPDAGSGGDADSEVDAASVGVDAAAPGSGGDLPPAEEPGCGCGDCRAGPRGSATALLALGFGLLRRKRSKIGRGPKAPLG